MYIGNVLHINTEKDGVEIIKREKKEDDEIPDDIPIFWVNII